MDRPVLRIFAALLWVTWFGVVAPLHRRGVITVDGKYTPVVKSCCARAELPANSHSKDGQKVPASQRCAICAMLSMAGITTPPPTITLRPLGTQQVVDDAVPALTGLTELLSQHCRGPPVG